MIIRVQKHHKDFFLMENNLARNKTLSYRAKGLMAYLLSCPDDWTIRLNDLVNHSPNEGPDSIRSAFRELKTANYARLVRDNEEGGKIIGSHWVVYERPIKDKTEEEPIKSNGSPTGHFAESRSNRNPVKPESGQSDPTNTYLVLRTEKEKKTEEEVAEFLRAWKETSLPQIKGITGKRKSHLYARMNEPFFRDNWKEGIQRVIVSSFCAGKSDQGWRMDMDFFLRPDSIFKILEGKYDDRKPFEDISSNGLPK